MWRWRNRCSNFLPFSIEHLKLQWILAAAVCGPRERVGLERTVGTPGSGDCGHTRIQRHQHMGESVPHNPHICNIENFIFGT